MSKKKEVYQPDDRLFKRLTEDKENVQYYLKHFYPEIAAIADLSTLKSETVGSMRPNLKLFKADTIYRCRFKGSSKNHFYLSLLFEHKSAPDKYVAIQVGLYIMLMMYKMAKDKDRTIEPVLPLIFYNGKTKWEPQTIRQLFELHPYYKELEPYLPGFRFLFKNIVDEPIEKLLRIELSYLRSMLLSMAFRYQPDLIIKYLSVILEVNSKDELQTVITYVLAIMERSPKEFMEELKDIEFTTKPEAMSTLEMLKEEGRQEGRLVERVIQLLKLQIRFRDMPASEMASLTNLPQSSIESFQSACQSGKEEEIKQVLQKALLEDIELSDENRESFQSLIAEIVRTW